MADDGFDRLPYRDTLRVPSILVLPGDPWPADFYSRYPEAFRVPARLAWRAGSSAQDAATPAARPSFPATSMRPDVTADAQTDAAQAEYGGAANDERPDPVGTFLRMNDILDRFVATHYGANPMDGKPGMRGA